MSPVFPKSSYYFHILSPLDKYMKAFNFGLSQDDIEEAIDFTLSGITELLGNEIINLLEINSTIMKICRKPDD